MAESLRRCVILPLDREWVPTKSIGRLVVDAVLAYLAEKHVNDEVPEHDPDFDPVAESHMEFGFYDESTTPNSIRKAILESRAAGQIVVREADGFGVIRDDDVMRGVVARDDLAKLLFGEWRIDLIAPPSPDSDAEPSGAVTPAETYELEPVPWEPQDVAGLVRVPLVLEQADRAEPTPAALPGAVAPAKELANEGNAPQSLPLTTGNIAFCFAGLPYIETKWKKQLGNKPKWLAGCIAIDGQRGVRERRWNPVCIGAALLRRGYVREVRSVRARFQTQPLLLPWLEAWKTYEAEYIDSV